MSNLLVDETSQDLVLREFLRHLTNLLGGEWGYGTDYENETFLIHPFCWCEEEDCPWCSECNCPESAFHYLIDGQEVSYETWRKYYEDRVPSWRDPNWEKISNEVNSHRDKRHDPSCDFCIKDGPFGKIPRHSAPNFWHKSSGLRIWWYKYIGRSMEIYCPTKINLETIMSECLQSLPKMEE